MAFLARSGDPERAEAVAVCMTKYVSKSTLPDGDCREFLIDQFIDILRHSKGIFRMELDIRNEYIFTIYTYAEPLEDEDGGE
jgi:hypothetical protein